MLVLISSLISFQELSNLHVHCFQLKEPSFEVFSYYFSLNIKMWLWKLLFWNPNCLLIYHSYFCLLAVEVGIATKWQATVEFQQHNVCKDQVEHLFYHRYFRLRKWDWKWVHVRTINTSTPCWYRNEHIDHTHLFQHQSPMWNWRYGSRLTSMQADSSDMNDRLGG